MTAAQLRDALQTLLEQQLGEYTTPGGSTMPAIRLGEPPSDYIARGLECRVAVLPEVSQLPSYQRSSLSEAHRVRLVMHGGDEATMLTAIRRISSRFVDASFREIPANAQLGILAQHTVTIPA